MLSCRRDQRCLRLLSLNRNASTGQREFRTEESLYWLPGFPVILRSTWPINRIAPPLRLRRSLDGISMKWTTFIACGVEQLTDFVVVPTEFSLGNNRGVKLT